jgi:hypothetical protein
MNKLDIIERIIQIEDAQVLKKIECLLLAVAALSKEQAAPQKEKTYRIKGASGFVFELGDNFASLKTFKNGKHLVAEDRTLRAVTRGYLEMLITHAGSFVKRSEIEKHIYSFADGEDTKRFSSRTQIYEVFRYNHHSKAKISNVPLSIYKIIEIVNSWDPEYRIPSNRITVLKASDVS